MPGLDRDQLDLLRRQIEDEYRLDMAAIERLQRRFVPQIASSVASSSIPSHHVSPVLEGSANPLPSIDPLAPSQPDELTGSLRAMFSNHRK